MEELGALGDFHFPRFFGRIEGFVASFFSSSPTEKEDSFFDEFFFSDQKGIVAKATLSVLRKTSTSEVSRRFTTCRPKDFFLGSLGRGRLLDDDGDEARGFRRERLVWGIGEEDVTWDDVSVARRTRVESCRDKAS